MKNFNDCKEEIAKKHGFMDWDHLLSEWICENNLTENWLNARIEEAAEMYATEVAKSQRKADADYVGDSIFTPRGNKPYIKAHILSTPLVTDKPT